MDVRVELPKRLNQVFFQYLNGNATNNNSIPELQDHVIQIFKDLGIVETNLWMFETNVRRYVNHVDIMKAIGTTKPTADNIQSLLEKPIYESIPEYIQVFAVPTPQETKKVNTGIKVLFGFVIVLLLMILGVILRFIFGSRQKTKKIMQSVQSMADPQIMSSQ